LLVAVLALFVALGASMPAYARLLAGPQPHVCHCETSSGGHAHCACPICFPELRADDDLLIGGGVAKGVCGDDDPAYRPVVDQGVFAPTVTALLPEDRSERLVPYQREHVSRSYSVDPRPPRA
jgi:hypothetical protein